MDREHLNKERVSNQKYQTVKEFVENNPSVNFNMLTPDGYVYLTPEKAQTLLSGQSVKGNLGSSEYSFDISADELSNQEICDASFCNGTWYILCNYVDEPKQEQKEQQEHLNFKQVVTM